tara:strand:+ start:67992 stop:69146 length:1155 start_codon:yes stop_codon:yes gene_type:complete
MLLPNYKDGSVVNLMSSVGGALGAKSKYTPLKILKPDELKSAKNVVLLVIDGLGFEFLQKYGKNSVFSKHLRGKITSVFPTVTSTVVPTFFTGLSSQDHGMTGWHIFLKELGCVIRSLPYDLRTSRFSLAEVKDISSVFNLKPFTNKISCNSYVVTQKDLMNSPFSIATAGKAKRYAYTNLNGCFKTIKKVITLNSKKKFIHAYWPNFDSLCHRHGTKSKKVLTHFKQLNKEVTSFLKSIESTNTVLIITADHGMIDVPKTKRIHLKNHPLLAETLTVPLCGDWRYVYCYVKPDKTKQFARYVKKKLKHCCTLHKSKHLVKKNYFGLGKPSKKFLERIGDYTLIMKEGYALYESLAHEKGHYNKGDHGGLSKEELYVPLVVVNK